MSYWWLTASIIMGIGSVWMAWLFFMIFSKTVPEPDFMEEDRGIVDQTEARRIDAMGQTLYIRI